MKTIQHPRLTIAVISFLLGAVLSAAIFSFKGSHKSQPLVGLHDLLTIEFEPQDAKQLLQHDGFASRPRVAAEIIDIQPNGKLVLEAHRRQIEGGKISGFKVSGSVDRDRVRANNAVSSEDISNLIVENRNE